MCNLLPRGTYEEACKGLVDVLGPVITVHVIALFIVVLLLAENVKLLSQNFFPLVIGVGNSKVVK